MLRISNHKLCHPQNVALQSKIDNKISYMLTGQINTFMFSKRIFQIYNCIKLNCANKFEKQNHIKGQILYV